MKESIRQISNKFIKEHQFRAEMTLCLNLVINFLFAFFEAACGFLFHSAWMGTLAFYYILLSIMRLLLVKGKGHMEVGKKWGKCVQCGCFLLLFTIVLVGMSILMQRGKESIHYPGYLIYGVAAYTFYAVITAIWKVNKFRKMNDPIYFTSKVLNLAVALVSIFLLQSAMIRAFGNDPGFARIMGIAMGFGAFVVIILK